MRSRASSLDDLGHQIEPVAGLWGYGEQTIAVDLAARHVVPKPEPRLVRVGHRLHPIGRYGVHLRNEAENPRQILRVRLPLFPAQTQTGKMGYFFDIFRVQKGNPMQR